MFSSDRVLVIQDRALRMQSCLLHSQRMYGRNSTTASASGESIKLVVYYTAIQRASTIHFPLTLRRATLQYLCLYQLHIMVAWNITPIQLVNISLLFPAMTQSDNITDNCLRCVLVFAFLH